MRVKEIRGSQRGAAAVEYGIVIALVSSVMAAGVSALGVDLSDTFANTSQNLSAGSTGAQGAPADAASDTPSADAPATDAPASGGALPGSDDGAGAVPGGTDEQASSAGTMTFYIAIVDQDQRKRDLSARVNLGWFPDSWSDVQYPDSLTIDVTWTPALEVDQVITGDSGQWDYALVGPGRLRLTRTGSLGTSGFSPEPEILLIKPGSSQSVSVTFTAEVPNTPSVSASSTTMAVPYP